MQSIASYFCGDGMTQEFEQTARSRSEMMKFGTTTQEVLATLSGPGWKQFISNIAALPCKTHASCATSKL